VIPQGNLVTPKAYDAGSDVAVAMELMSSLGKGVNALGKSVNALVGATKDVAAVNRKLVSATEDNTSATRESTELTALLGAAKILEKKETLTDSEQHKLARIEQTIVDFAVQFCLPLTANETKGGSL